MKNDHTAKPNNRTVQELKTPEVERIQLIQINEFIHQAVGVANTFLITTQEGNIVFDTALAFEASIHKELLQAIDSGPIKYIIVSHAHADHAGGVHVWKEGDTEVITDRYFPIVQRYLTDLEPFMWKRNRFFYEEVMPPDPPGPDSPLAYGAVEPTILIEDQASFELGGLRFDVIHTPGAEGIDSISVWLPDYKILFSGDFFGPLFPMWPNLYTFRGEPYRFAMPYVDSLNRVLELEPEIILPSHFDAIYGKDQIKDDILRMRDAVLYVHEAVVKGMNEGKELYTLMSDISLPPELKVSEGHGKVSWGVRSIWEGYAGWFYFDSTTVLYPVPAKSIHHDIIELAGGSASVVTRAADKLASGKPVEALHLIDIVLTLEPDNRAALEVQLEAHKTLLDYSDKENFHEVTWLRRMIRITEASLTK